jgi:hypothetical protein
VEKRKQRSTSITEEPKKLSRVHPNFSKIHIDDEDKLATNPFASPFKKVNERFDVFSYYMNNFSFQLSQASAITPAAGAATTATGQ